MVITVNTTGSCGSIKATLPNEGTPVTSFMTPSGATFTLNVNKNAYTWSTGNKTIVVKDSSNVQIASIALVVTN